MPQFTYKPYKPSWAASMHWAHWLVVTLSLILTFTAWYISKTQIDAKTLQQFERETEQTVELVEERMEKYEDALWSGVAAIHSQDYDINSEKWRSFASALRIETRHPGINGIGVIYYVSPSKLESFLTEQHKLRPDFKIHPPHKQNEFWPITYIEPIETNRRALGLDMAHETNRLTAIKKARDTGKAQITGPIILVQDSKKTPGFLFYAPFYKGKKNYATTEERQQNFIGAVYAPFIMHKLMEGTLQNEKRLVNLSISDGEQTLYDEHIEGQEDVDANPLFAKDIEIEMFGRPWQFHIQSTKSFRAVTQNSQPQIILIGGIIIDALLLFIFITLSRSHKKAQESLTSAGQAAEESRSFLELIMDNNPDLIFVKDEDFRIVEANAAFLNLYPKEMRDSIIGSTTLEKYDPEEAEAFLAQDKIAFKDGHSETIETIHFPDGRFGTLYTNKVRFENQAGEKFILGIARDITELRHAENSLASIGRILEESLNEVYIFDAETLNFVEVNRGGRKNIGYTMEELERLTPVDLKPQYTEESFRKLLQNLKETAVIETTHKRKDGTFYDVEAHIQRTNYKGKEVFTAIVLDISERRKAEAKQLKLMDKLTQSNTELERFAYVASHDMQEPIRMIINFSQILADDYQHKLDDEGKEYLNLLVTHGKRMRDMIYDLLEYARVGNTTTTISEVDTQLEMQHVIANLEPLINETNADITFDNLPTIHGSPVQFISLMQNLVANGIKYQTPGNTPEITITAEDQGDHWHFSVQDNGIGISEEHSQDIFQPFRRLHNQKSFKGTGLGLTSCGRIVENHGGKIWVDSTLGKGSTFHFTFAKNIYKADDIAA